MGNENTKQHGHHDEKKTVITPSLSSAQQNRNPKFERAFARVSNGSDGIDYKRLVELFGEDFSESLWKYFAPTKSHSEQITPEEFYAKVEALTGNSTDVYVRICFPVPHILKVCSDASGAHAVHGDEDFIKRLTQEMISCGETADNVADWKRATCPRLCNALQALLLEKFFNEENKRIDYLSDILTPMQMWYLQCCVPNTYFSKDEKVWTPLYTSLQHGISANRFEALVFDYRGPTVTIIRLQDGRTVTLANDQEWRHGSSRFGGPATCFFEFSPNIKRIDAPNSIYANLKIRSASFGISFKDVLKIDKELSEVLDIEVWGCASANTLAEQQKLRNWQMQQAEKRKKVPLPGNWDDNPDKTLLEMAGFQFSNERKLMEMEAEHN